MPLPVAQLRRVLDNKVHPPVRFVLTQNGELLTPSREVDVDTPVDLIYQPPAEHAYVVWHVPGALALSGIWTGGHRVWSRLERALPNGRYRCADGTRLRRAANMEEAVVMYQSEMDRHAAPASPTIHPR